MRFRKALPRRQISLRHPSPLILHRRGIKKLFRMGQNCSIFLINRPADRIWRRRGEWPALEGDLRRLSPGLSAASRCPACFIRCSSAARKPLFPTPAGLRKAVTASSMPACCLPACCHRGSLTDRVIGYFSTSALGIPLCNQYYKRRRGTRVPATPRWGRIE